MSARDLGALVCLALFAGFIGGVVATSLVWILRQLFCETRELFRETPGTLGVSAQRVCVSNSEHRDGV